MGHAYTKKLLVVYLKLKVKFNWCPVLLFATSGNHTSIEVMLESSYSSVHDFWSPRLANTTQALSRFKPGYSAIPPIL